jgi:hypothetical protein
MAEMSQQGWDRMMVRERVWMMSLMSYLWTPSRRLIPYRSNQGIIHTRIFSSILIRSCSKMFVWLMLTGMRRARR